MWWHSGFGESFLILLFGSREELCVCVLRIVVGRGTFVRSVAVVVLVGGEWHMSIGGLRVEVKLCLMLCLFL